MTATKECPGCGKPFKSYRPQHKYCSAKCRTEANNKDYSVRLKSVAKLKGALADAISIAEGMDGEMTYDARERLRRAKELLQ